MTLADWIQVVSFPFVVLGGVFLYHQNKHLRTSLQQVAYQDFIGSQNDLHMQYFRDDPDLLRWHLRSWGFPQDEDETVKDKHLFFALLKLDVHESAFLNHQGRLLRDEVFEPWERVLIADFSRPEFQLAWTRARDYYATAFVERVDQIIRELPRADPAP